jgi:hypothetical protein
MRILFTLLGVVILVAPFQQVVAKPPLTKLQACAVLKRRIAKSDGIPETGPINMGWYCDFSPLSDTHWYVIALRSNRRCDGIFSNLMGWYAVNRSSGSVNEYDVADLEVGAALGDP